MAYKRRLRSASAKRRSKRRLTYRKTKSKRLRLFRNPFPENKFIKLVYYDQGSIDPSVTSPCATQVYRANSLFDPDQSGGGHQPRYRDIMASLYERYAVISSSLQVTMWAPGSASAGQCVAFAGVRPTSDDVPNSVQTYTDLAENGAIRFRSIGSRDGGHDLTRVTAYYNPRKLYRKSPYNEDDLQALFGANPSTSPVLFFGAVPVIASDDIGAIRYTAKMTFNVLCMRKKHDLTQD